MTEKSDHLRERGKREIQSETYHGSGIRRRTGCISLFRDGPDTRCRNMFRRPRGLRGGPGRTGGRLRRSHDNEVIANQDLTGDQYPGAEQVDNRAVQICYDNFSDYVGIAYEDSIYDIGWLYPTEETWAAGDREVICFGYRVDLAKITGSINGIGE